MFFKLNQTLTSSKLQTYSRVQPLNGLRNGSTRLVCRDLAMLVAIRRALRGVPLWIRSSRATSGVAAAQTTAPKSTGIAPSAGLTPPTSSLKATETTSGASSAVSATDIDGADGGEWISPDNVSEHMGQGGLSKSFVTVRQLKSCLP